MDYPTPQEFFNQLNETYHFTLDPCASKDNAKCERYYTKEQDGLKQKWEGRVFCNPPYGREIGKWIKKGFDEVGGGNCEIAVFLIPSRTDTKYFHEYVMRAKEIYFVKSRLKFDGKNSAPFPSCIVVFSK
jgi:site-specific DNA-methyltransferase (adenine-specific)